MVNADIVVRVFAADGKYLAIFRNRNLPDARRGQARGLDLGGGWEISVKPSRAAVYGVVGIATLIVDSGPAFGQKETRSGPYGEAESRRLPRLGVCRDVDGGCLPQCGHDGRGGDGTQVQDAGRGCDYKVAKNG